MTNINCVCFFSPNSVVKGLKWKSQTNIIANMRKHEIKFNIKLRKLLNHNHSTEILIYVLSISEAYQDGTESNGVDETDLVFLKGILDNPAVTQNFKVSIYYTNNINYNFLWILWAIFLNYISRFPLPKQSTCHGTVAFSTVDFRNKRKKKKWKKYAGPHSKTTKTEKYHVI